MDGIPIALVYSTIRLFDHTGIVIRVFTEMLNLRVPDKHFLKQIVQVV